MAGLYVHIPFCLKKCAYCDFVSYPVGHFVAGALSRYVDTLLSEARLWKKALDRLTFETVFIGGGTPSLIEPEDIRRLTEGLRQTLHILPGAEWTMEANPGTVTQEGLNAAWEAGINRLSLGMQANQDRLLGCLGRQHRSGDVETAVRMARDAGFSNINLDVMYALPGQTPEDYLKTLDAAILLSPTHISAYSLIVEEGTPFGSMAERGELSLPDEDAVDRMETQGREKLKQAGYSQYEISNYAVPGCECRHNINYWENGMYIGLGAAAHSSMVIRRWENPPSLTQYTDAIERGKIPNINDRMLDADDVAFETVMMGLRMVRGIDLEQFEHRFKAPFIQVFPSWRKLERQGLAQQVDGYARLTERGRDVMNTLLVELMKDTQHES